MERNENNEIKFHPSNFQNLSVAESAVSNNRTLTAIQKEREQKVDSAVDKFKSPGSFSLTPDDKALSSSNTSHLFKNLFGETLLTRLFFSDKNVQSIQNLIKFLVHRETKYVVDTQSTKELLIVMRGIFLEHNSHPPLPDKKMTDDQRTKLYIKYQNEVARLNELVVNYSVPKVVSQMQQYVLYLRDASQPLQIMDKPKFDSITGERQYRTPTQVFFGGNF